MDKRTYAVIEKYTSPFVQLVLEKSQQDQVFEELTQIKSVFEETKLADFLSHIGVDKTQKEQALRYFQAQVSPLVNNFIEVVILNGREDLFFTIVKESLSKLEKASNEFEVTIKTVQGLSEEQKQRLCPIIENKFGLKVRAIKEELDEDLIGGFIITANNKTIDASIRRQLQAVKENLK